MSAHELLRQLSAFSRHSAFPRLKKLVISEFSLVLISDRFLSALAEAHPDLIELRIDAIEMYDGFEADGMSRLFEGCTRLEDLHLCCPPTWQAHTIPDSIDRLAGLKNLYLEAFNFDLPDSITSLQSLESLTLRTYRLRRLPQDLGNLTLLKSLQLESCAVITSLPTSIHQLTNLHRLSIIACSRLRLPDILPDFPALRILDIRDCGAISPLPENLGQLQALETLQVEQVMGLRALTRLPASSSGLTSLTTLHLSGVSFSAVSGDIGCWLSRLRTLKVEGGRLTSVPDSLWLAAALQKLHIKDLPSLASLPDCFGQLTALKTLHLSGLPSLTSLPEGFGQLRALEILHLWRLEALTHLPESLGQLKNLQELDMYSCDKLRRLPDSLGRLSSLERLKVNHCPVLTALPEGMGSGLQSLRELLLNCEKSLPPPFIALLHSIARNDRDCGSQVLQRHPARELWRFWNPKEARSKVDAAPVGLPCFNPSPRAHSHQPHGARLPRAEGAARGDTATRRVGGTQNP
ncbi:hypothetical protein CLOM_g23645 [Closterium sp. NIES-68]|nr:hypothetical protein CLOM_g23645 [Closterium sp. NIES-68]GJP86863.1 hypothetical protein CLOP_g16837 [Closterium sp. NIES-67]